jgi:hypothetical protein
MPIPDPRYTADVDPDDWPRLATAALEVVNTAATTLLGREGLDLRSEATTVLGLSAHDEDNDGAEEDDAEGDFVDVLFEDGDGEYPIGLARLGALYNSNHPKIAALIAAVMPTADRSNGEDDEQAWELRVLANDFIGSANAGAAGLLRQLPASFHASLEDSLFAVLTKFVGREDLDEVSLPYV